MESQNETEEFSRPDRIKLKMQLTPEQASERVDFFREWAASVPTLYFLDICVVGATKLSQVQLEKNERKAKIVEHLRSLDRPQHGFSYLFALMEKVSDSRGIALDAELEQQILGDLAALRTFFEHAKVYEANDFVIQFLRELRRSAIELERPNYLIFLETINDSFDIREPVARSLRFERAEKIVALAHSLEIYHQHPIVTVVLACLYGNRSAKKLLKFKADFSKFNAENVLADIMAITRFAKQQLQIYKISRSGGKYAQSSFITDDDGLIGIIDCFQPEHMIVEKTSEGATTRYTLTVELQKLLTEIDADEYEKVASLLTAAPTNASEE
ncbi:hypothetical protein [Pseudomonas viridiflava]|uniref:hypothetical protein n=1 Tax=Pseudomonas viridiflava TaxID=33069 RepID=UPI000F012BB8|nr:hypothetical protein [Pseudomonas viridiflava]QVI85918.1 hypothetical protein KHW14_00715 [Pseudomonas viridiflava]